MRLINIRKKYFSNAFHNEMLKGTLSMILEFFLSRKFRFPFVSVHLFMLSKHREHFNIHKDYRRGHILPAAPEMVVLVSLESVDADCAFQSPGSHFKTKSMAHSLDK